MAKSIKVKLARAWYWALSPVHYGFGSRVMAALTSSSLLQALVFKQAVVRFLRFKELDTSREMNKAMASRYLLSNCANDWRLYALSHVSPALFDEWVSVEGLEYLKSAIKSSQGVVLVNSHFGASRCVPLAIARNDVPLHSLESLDVLAKIGAANRENLKVLEVGAGKKFLLKPIRAAQKLLSKGGVLHIVPDGLQGVAGVPVSFLGRERKVSTSFAELAFDTGAVILPVTAELEVSGRVKVIISPALESNSTVRSEAVAQLVESYAQSLERSWRKDPTGIKSHHLAHVLNLPLIKR